MTTTTISLEPLLQGLQVTSPSEPVASTSKQAGEVPLSLRLLRLWHERGDFSALSETALLEEQLKDQEASVAEDVKEHKKLDDTTDALDGDEAEDAQGMIPDELWDLKVNILTGLKYVAACRLYAYYLAERGLCSLARRDVTSALDVLQLLLNPLGALNPPVPEEALALPSASLSATSLHTPLPAPPESVHLQGTALSYSTKASATKTAAVVLRSASKRLQRTTSSTQAEWTDLIRLDRGGQWPLQARGAPGSSRDIDSRVPIDKMAKDVCLSCGIDEAAIQWRQGGLVRFKERDVKGRGRMRDIFDVPERLEGRRRLCISATLANGQSSYFGPLVKENDVQELNAFLTDVQLELFEEELFGQVCSQSSIALFFG